MESKSAVLVDQAKKWATHYGAFTKGPEGAALSAPLRVRGAWDRNDAAGVADAFTANGSMLLGDEQMRGREAIQAYLGEAFAGGLAGSRIEDEPGDIFFIDPDTALVISTGGIVSKGESSLSASQRQRVSWLVVRDNGEWRLFSYQSSPIKG
ncbi:SgcJ/EcaC family oxidoreductase [Micromonospora sp. NPDC049051]|uniref:SgcJ/EcaC family oxidoreductase n=1 Tax=unclassified Micromonospora TaxID=2617518 RepID=UPI003710D397